MYLAGYENGISDVQEILMGARQWHGMNVQDLLIRLDMELDKLRDYSGEK
jgi:hypothetical protein